VFFLEENVDESAFVAFFFASRDVGKMKGNNFRRRGTVDA